MKKKIVNSMICLMVILASCKNSNNSNTESVGAVKAEYNAFFDSDCQECAAVLKKDVIMYSQTTEQKISEIINLTEYQYSELKRDASIGATIPLAEFLIKGSANYSEYQQRASYYRLNSNYWSSYSQTTNFESYVTSPLAYQAWTECVKNNCGNTKGFRGFVTESNKDFFKFTCGYRGDANSIKVTITSDNGDIYLNNSKKGATYSFNLKTARWEDFKLVRKDIYKTTLVSIKTDKDYPPIELKSSYVDLKRPIIGDPMFVVQDRPVSKGGQIASVSFSKDQLKPGKSYEIIVDLPFYKDHQRDCPSPHPNKYSYVAQFAMYVNDKKVQLMPNSDLVTISVSTDDKHKTSWIRANTILVPQQIFSAKSLDKFSADNGMVVKLVQEGDYYSPCLQNTNEGMMFTAGGVLMVREIQ